MNKVKDFLYEKESYLIRGACFEIWNEFKGAFKESIVDNSLTIALQNKGLKVESQKKINIYFQKKKVGVYVPDKIVNGIIILELKTKPFITRYDLEQLWRYLKGSNYRLGFLINFSPSGLVIKRVVYDKSRDKSASKSAVSAKSAFNQANIIKP